MAVSPKFRPWSRWVRATAELYSSSAAAISGSLRLGRLGSVDDSRMRCRRRGRSSGHGVKDWGNTGLARAGEA
eukprot:1742850-Pleurochrysis_carterae.AAC.1